MQRLSAELNAPLNKPLFNSRCRGSHIPQTVVILTFPKLNCSYLSKNLVYFLVLTNIITLPNWGLVAADVIMKPRSMDFEVMFMAVVIGTMTRFT